MPDTPTQLAEIRKDIAYIKRALIGDITDDRKPGLVVRLDRIEQRQKVRDKFLWLIVTTVVTNIAVSLWTSTN